MPYIHKLARLRVDKTRVAETPGELNYLFTTLINRYVKAKGLSYQTCNDIVGALDNAKGEFKRRIQDPYEDTKIETNGEVYTCLPKPKA